MIWLESSGQHSWNGYDVVFEHDLDPADHLADTGFRDSAYLSDV